MKIYAPLAAGLFCFVSGFAGDSFDIGAPRFYLFEEWLPSTDGFHRIRNIELRKAGVPAELLVYNRGGHGFGMTGRTAEFQKMPVASWLDRLQESLTDVGFLRHSGLLR